MATELQLPGATKVIPGLYVGGIDACEPASKLLRAGERIGIVHACKSCHRRMLGYEGRGAPKENPEYLLAARLQEIFCNLIDAPKMEFIPKALIDTAVLWIGTEITAGREVLVHCDQGNSRAPAIAFLFMASRGYFAGKHLEAACSQFRDTVYPNFAPGLGINGFMDVQWWGYNR